MRITGVNHLTFAVADLQQSISFYEEALGAELRYRDERTAYFDLNGIWLALNIQTDLPRTSVPPSYTHIAFTVAMKDIDDWEQRLRGLGVNVVPGRARDEGKDSPCISPTLMGIYWNCTPAIWISDFGLIEPMMGRQCRRQCSHDGQ